MIAERHVIELRELLDELESPAHASCEKTTRRRAALRAVLARVAPLPDDEPPSWLPMREHLPPRVADLEMD